MSNVARRRFVLGCVLAVLILALILFVSRGPISDKTDAGAGAGGATALVGSAGSFTIRGNTTEAISPGVKASLDLLLTNPHAFPMSVTDLNVRVQKVSAPNADDAHPCAVGDFAVDQASATAKITLTARSTTALSGLGLARTTWPQVGMFNRLANQDGCKGASLTLAYTASGTLTQ
ncbi:MAG: hypothetical protein ABI903_07760 [Actinomycetota bacterium]